MAIWMYYAAYTASLGEISTKTAEGTGGYDISYKVRLCSSLIHGIIQHLGFGGVALRLLSTYCSCGF